MADSNTQTTTTENLTCDLTGYPMVRTTTTRTVFAIHSDRQRTIDMDTMEEAKNGARWLRDNAGHTVRLARETRTKVSTEYVGEYAELYADRLAAGEFDPA